MNQESDDTDLAKDADPQVHVDTNEADTNEADTNEESRAETAESSTAQISAESQSDQEAHVQASAELVEDAAPQLHIVPVTPLDANHIRSVIEAALLAADDALTLDRLLKLFVPGELAEEGERAQVRDALTELTAACEGRGFELKKVASGYRMQVRQNLSPWVSRLWDEKPPRYTRALLETMALIAYKQPATRGDIEEVRGVTVSSNIMRTLLERGWIREVGQRDVPGRPSMYGTTKEFLDYFNLSSLDELPSLPEIRELVEPAATTPDNTLDSKEESRSDATKALLEQEDGPPELDDHAADETEAAEEAQGADEEQAADDEQTADDDQSQTAAADDVFSEDEVLVVSESADVNVTNSAALGVDHETPPKDASVANTGE